MKVISILQPWASLIVLGHKKIETRSRNTNYRGELLIHASQRWDNSLYQILIDIGAEEILDKAGYRLTKIKNGKISTNLPLGAIIGKVNLVDSFQFITNPYFQLQSYKGNDNPWIPYRENGNDFDDIDEEAEWIENVERELAFGDYSPGRYGWYLTDPVQFDTPVPAKGKLGLWEYTGAI